MSSFESEPKPSTSTSEFSVWGFYSAKQVMDAIETNAPVTKKQKNECERKLKQEKIQAKWIALCEKVELFPFLYDTSSEDWKNTALKKKKFSEITAKLNKTFGDKNSGTSTF